MELSSPLICFNVWSLDISVVPGCFKISLSGTWAVLFRHWAELSRYLPASIISPKFAEIIWYCHPPRLQTRDTSRANKHPQLCIIRPLSSSSTQVWVEQLAADPRSQGIKTWETWGGSFARSSGRRWQEVSASSSAVSVLRHAVISPVLQSSDTQEGYTQEKKWRDSPPPRTMCRVAVLCSRQQPPTINLGESIYQLLTLWMLKLAACPD